MTPTNTQKLTYIRRHFEKSLEIAGKATSGWHISTGGDLLCNLKDSDNRVVCSVIGGIDSPNASFIAAARTDCPMAMEMVVEQIDYMIEMSGADGSGWVLYRLGNKLISRFESSHGTITREQIENL
jgi:hypothetical protein